MIVQARNSIFTKQKQMKKTNHPNQILYNRRNFVGLSAAFITGIATRHLYASPLFTNVELQSIKQDWHMHTYRAGGKPDAIVADIINTNEAYGLDLMGISEHIDRPDQRPEFIEKITANRNEADAVSTKKMKVMIGTESSMINPNLCAVGHEIPNLLDYVLVSCNHYHLKHVENPKSKTAASYADHYLDMLTGATELGYVDTIGHPFYHQKLVKKLGRNTLLKVLKVYNEERLTTVLKKSAEVDMAFELNPRHADLALDWFKDLIVEARLHGTKFTLGTDAHAIPSLGYPDQPNRTCLDVLNDLNLTKEDLKWKSIKGVGIKY
jgi:histidinol phosphatase-like PHP family hydrolase